MLDSKQEIPRYGPRGHLAPRDRRSLLVRVLSSLSPPRARTDVPWYRPDIPPVKLDDDKEVIQFYTSSARSESHDELVQRLHQIRDRAWAIAPYPTFGQWHFLHKGLKSLPFYEDIVEQVKRGATVLDIGCGLGQDIRRLIAAAGQGDCGGTHAKGVKKVKRYVADVRPDLWNLGLELFGDGEDAPAQFIEADVATMPNVTVNPLKYLEGQIDIFIMCQLLELFQWERQLFVLQNVLRTSVVGSVVVGYGYGTLLDDTGQHGGDGHLNRMLHSPETLSALWTDASSATRTKWKLEAVATDLLALGYEAEDIDWMERPPKTGLYFRAYREA